MNWIARRVHFRLVPLPVLSTCGAGRCRRCRRCRVSSLGCSWLLVRLLPRPALLASCLSCWFSSGVSAVSACYPFRSFRPIVVSFGSSLVRQVGRGDGGLRLGLGSPRLLLPVACRGGSWMWRGGFRRPVACRRCGLLSGRRVSLMPSPRSCLLRPVVVVGSSWADRRRAAWSWFLLVVGRSCSSSVAVARRRPACLSSGVVIGSVHPVAVRSSSVLSSFALSPRLACRWGGVICVPSSRVARCSACVSWFRSFPAAGRLALVPVVPSPLLALSRLGLMRGRGGYRGGAARVWACCLLAPPRLMRRRRGYLVPTCCLPSICVSPRPSYRRGGAIFPVSVVFSVLAYSSMMA